MSKPLGLSLLLATTLGLSSLAFAAAGAQPAVPATASSSSPMQNAQHGQHGKWHDSHHRRGNHHGMGTLSRLDLTDAQRADVRKMMHQSFEQARPAMQALRQQRQAYEAATPGSSAYQAAADQLATAEANAARERVIRQAELRTKIYGVLTPEQRTRFASLRADRKQRMQKWRSDHARHGAPASAASTD